MMSAADIPSAPRASSFGLDLVVDVRDADHEELVEVVLVDGREVDPLEQRNPWVLGELQDPVVEVEPGELAVEVEGRVRQIAHPRCFWPHLLGAIIAALPSTACSVDSLRPLGELVGHVPTLAVSAKPL